MLKTYRAEIPLVLEYEAQTLWAANRIAEHAQETVGTAAQKVMESARITQGNWKLDEVNPDHTKVPQRDRKNEARLRRYFYAYLMLPIACLLIAVGVATTNIPASAVGFLLFGISLMREVVERVRA